MADAEKKDGKKSSGAKSNNYVYELVKGQIEVVIKDVLNEILPEMLKEILNEILQPMLKDILDEILADVVEHVVKDIVRDTRKNIREHLSPSRFFSKSPSTASLFSQNTDSPTDTAEAEEELDEVSLGAFGKRLCLVFLSTSYSTSLFPLELITNLTSVRLFWRLGN